MTASRRYHYDWIGRVPGIEGAYKSCAFDAPGGAWISSLQAWSAFAQSIIEFKDVSLGHCIRRFPVRSLIGCLRVISSAETPEDALLNLRIFGRLAELPFRLNLQTESETTFIILALEGVDAAVMADLEVMLLTLIMTVLNWMVGETIPYLACYSKSQLFQSLHPYHPEFDCEVRVTDWTGVSVPHECLKAASVQKGLIESFSDILSWLIFGNFGQAAEPKRVVREGR